MSRIYFEDLPSTNTPRNATNLNKLNNVVISSTEPNTGEEVWLQKGKNLFDGYFEIGGYDINTGEKVTDANSYRSTNASYVVPNKNYVFSINSQAISINTRYLFYDNNGNLLSTTTSANGSITTPANCYQLRWHSSGLKTNYPNGLTNAMIEQNSSATSYEAYVDKKIYTKNDNGVYEEFYNEANKDIYSTSETKIGTWLGKPLYRKVIDAGQPSISTGSTASIAHNISNLKLIIDAKATFVTNNFSINYPLPYLNGTVNMSIREINGTNIIFKATGESWSGHHCWIILEYTKTTD